MFFITKIILIIKYDSAIEAPDGPSNCSSITYMDDARAVCHLSLLEQPKIRVGFQA